MMGSIGTSLPQNEREFVNDFVDVGSLWKTLRDGTRDRVLSRAQSALPAVLLASLLALLFTLSLPRVSYATSYNSPQIDGYINFTSADWDSNEVAIPDSPSDSKWPGNEIDSILVTWDADSLYVGYIYVVNNNAMVVLIDAGTGVGDSDINNLNWYPRNFRLSEGKAEVIIAGWNAGMPGVRRITGDGQTQDMSASCRITNSAQSGVKGAVEIAIPWRAIYELGAGRIKPGAILRIVGFVAGGDNYGGCDSAPDNPGVDGGAGPVILSNLFLAFCDRNGDGIPDEGFPPSGAIGGTVTLSNADDLTTVVIVTAFRAGTTDVAGKATAPAGGGAYRIGNLPDGNYDLTFEASSYVSRTLQNIAVSGGGESVGNDVTLQYVSGKITGTLSFADGPGALAVITAYVSGTTTAAGTSPVSVGPPGASFTISLLPDAGYDLVVTAPGYQRVTLPVTVSGGGTTDAGAIALHAVRGTKFVFAKSVPDSCDVLGTVSLPAAGIYLYVSVYVEARDSLGQLDIFNLSHFSDSVYISCSLLDPSLAPLGHVIVADGDTLELPGGLLTAASFQSGRATLLAADDVVEVLLIKASPAVSLGYGSPGTVRVGFLPRNPVSVELTIEPDAIEAGGVEKATVRGQLKDAVGSNSTESGVSVDLKLLSGEGTLAPASTTTDTNGQFEVEFYSSKAGLVVVSDSVLYNGQKLSTNSVSVTVIPGPGTYVELKPQYEVVYAELRFTIGAQITDAFGNEVAEPGVSISLFSSPSGRLSELSSPLVTDGNGHASGFATAAQSYGAVEISGNSPYAVQPVTLSIEADLVAVDESAPESDPLHHSIVGMDLTGVYVRLEDDTLKVYVPFESDWTGAHVAVIFETEGDEQGLLNDTFKFPIAFYHTLKPDFIFTDKFQANSDGDPGNDYADFRRWAGPGIDSFWDLAAQTWTTDASNSNKNAASWTRHDGTGVHISVPRQVMGLAVGDSLRVEAYCMDEPSAKRTALDSCPQDSTHDMTGNWWETAIDTVRLHNYGSLKLAALPQAPVISGAAVAPSPASTGEVVRVLASITPRDDGVGDVTVDLSAIGGSSVQRLYDDGTNGDATTGDAVYSYAFTVSDSVPGGVHTLTITARDDSNRSKSTASILLEIAVERVLIRSFEDPSDDDHGPNQYGKAGLYYLYPTNPVFYAGSFDLRNVEIIDEGDWLDFRVTIGDLTSPSEPNAANWNAIYPSATTCTNPGWVPLNLQNAVIFIDSEKGGATTALPNRWADVAAWDAWEFAIVADGWWKGALASNGSNDSYSWTKYKSDADYWFCTNYADNTMDMHVNKEILGNPSVEDVSKWDIIAVMSSHDGASTDENFGMVRWINEGSATEWNFGGGLSGESSRERDANIIDVATSSGEGKLAGKTQGEMLDYTTDAAKARFNAGQVAVVLEATRFEDYAPPAISAFPTNGTAVTRWFAMENAPLVIGTVVTDDDEVAEAFLKWRPLRGSFSSPIRMSHLLEDLWVADIDFSDVTSVVNSVEGKLYFELQVSATDRSGNTAESRLFTAEVSTERPEQYLLTDIEQYADPLTGEIILQGVPFVVPDGSALVIPAGLLPDTSKVYDLVFTSLSGVDLSHKPQGMGSFTGVARSFEIVGREADSTAGSGTSLTDFVEPFTVLLHYPAYAVGAGDARGLAIYGWQEETSRWVLFGGNATSRPGLVSVATRTPGTYGIFADRFSIDLDKTLSSVAISPNPFSPNGDGLYEETQISFYLSKAASVLIEIYDMRGQLVRRYDRKSYSEPGRIEGESWDGKDGEGTTVPYGIYIVRFEAIDQEYNRAERLNKAVVVIK
ncbi:MAG: gliding motility-associated C-terminal domain-containing protein [Candidatus Eisenbacteria bacterium]|nr:gliding motility-associated C-terminal domain-containing protein [Candidatus Eisenbacteria bacterium]